MSQRRSQRASAVLDERPIEPETAEAESVGYVSYSVSDLRYRLIAGLIPLEPMKVLNQCKVGWGEWEVELFVLGASHAMVLSNGRLRVTELLTCGPITANAAPVVDLVAVDDATQSTTIRGLQIDVEIRNLPFDKFGELSSSLPADCTLQHEFPATDFAGEAWTKLGWQITDAGFRLETLHTYSEDECCVHSVTTVTAGATQKGSRRYGR